MSRSLSPHNPIPNRLRDLVSLITGGAGNIGLESARRYLQEGAKVVLVDISSHGLAQSKAELINAIRDLPNAKDLDSDELILTIQADVTSEEDIQRCINESIQKFGKLDIALLCAGISYSSTSILDTDLDQYDKVMQVNCRSAFVSVKHCGRAMRDSGFGGSIILVSSIAGLRATPGLSAYSTSKFALRGLCITAAAELGQYNIRVNTVHPCGVNTPMFLAAWPEEKMKSMLSTVPLGRWAEVADIAALASFLGSADAQFMTGGALKVDGGIVMF
ncbi:2-5-dichloro-2-5-cyclohexadiene-1-4-diol dehydrogenase [Penicillium angulare]|uniref:2-5-dichloro-2-5-cyclohexadiene-1-4-diol dehydrogenase n=1 Tax=Penicillium angulare TaxID=116970 RepID=A0A9W9FHD2_9EURO|nr:2-5-dichloro-2-5-cyclohexadiene-1-4-diol dehydrogenase [Penicillium angulare]